MALYDTVIRGGMVVDGTRMPRRRCDVGIKDGRIAKLGHIRASDGARVLDAGGMVVAPGFVDLQRTTTRRSSGIRTARCPAGTA